MISFKIEGVEYKTPKGLSDITLGRNLEYIETIYPQIPKVLKELFSADFVEKSFVERYEELTNLELAKCYKYYSKVVAFWCKLDESVINKYLEIEQLEQAFFSIHLTLLLDKEEEDVLFKSFVINKKEYFLPNRFMLGSTVIEFAEAAQFEKYYEDFEQGNLYALLDVMTVICRPKDEVYDSENNEHRKDIFKKLTMDNFVQVGFFLLRLKNRLDSDLMIYLLQQALLTTEVNELIKSTDGI